MHLSSFIHSVDQKYSLFRIEEKLLVYSSFIQVATSKVPERPPDVGVILISQFPSYLTIVHEAVVGEEARRQVEYEGTEAKDESEIISVGEILSIVGGRHL